MRRQPSPPPRPPRRTRPSRRRRRRSRPTPGRDPGALRRPVRDGGPAGSRARRLDGVPGPVPGGRQRRGGPRARRLPRPGRRRARPERRRCRRPRRGARPAPPEAHRGGRPGPRRRQHRRAAGRRRRRGAVHAARQRQARRRDGRALRGRVRGGPRCHRRAGRRRPPGRRPLLPPGHARARRRRARARGGAGGPRRPRAGAAAAVPRVRRGPRRSRHRRRPAAARRGRRVRRPRPARRRRRRPPARAARPRRDQGRAARGAGRRARRRGAALADPAPLRRARPRPARRPPHGGAGAAGVESDLGVAPRPCRGAAAGAARPHPERRVAGLARAARRDLPARHRPPARRARTRHRRARPAGRARLRRPPRRPRHGTPHRDPRRRPAGARAVAARSPRPARPSAAPPPAPARNPLPETPGDAPGVRERWRLVPAGLPAGVLDGALRGALLELLPATPMLRSAEDPAVVLRPRAAVALEPPAGADADAVAVLAPLVSGLVAAPRTAAAVFDLPGVRRLALADVVDELPAPAGPEGWRRLLGGLAGLADDAAAREALAALPVPLADGRVARGARGVVLPPADPRVGAALAALGVRAVDPEVARPGRVRALLERLGATGVSGRSALDLPAVALAVDALADAEEAVSAEGDGRLDAVLTLVAAAVRDGGLEAGDLPWLGALPLPDAEGDLAPAAELVLPGSQAARLLDPDAVGLVDAAVTERWGPETLRAVGVLDGLGLLRAADVALDAPPDAALEELDDAGAWLDALADLADAALGSPLGAVVADVAAVRDLDAVRDDAWPEVLGVLAHDPALRSALLTPVRVLAPAGGAASGPSYTAWWLREHLAGGGVWADPDAPDALAALLPAPPPGLADADAAVRAALGAVADVGELDAGAVADVLDGLADPQVDVDVATALRVWAALAAVLAARPPDVAGTPPPSVVRVLRADGGTELVDAEEACVVGDPMRLQRTDLAPFVVAPDAGGAAALAGAFDLPLAGDLAAGEVEENGRSVPVPDAVAAPLPDAPATRCEPDQPVLGGVEADWWVEGDARVA